MGPCIEHKMENFVTFDQLFCHNTLACSGSSRYHLQKLFRCLGTVWGRYSKGKPSVGHLVSSTDPLGWFEVGQKWSKWAKIDMPPTNLKNGKSSHIFITKHLFLFHLAQKTCMWVIGWVVGWGATWVAHKGDKMCKIRSWWRWLKKVKKIKIINFAARIGPNKCILAQKFKNSWICGLEMAKMKFYWLLQCYGAKPFNFEWL